MAFFLWPVAFLNAAYFVGLLFYCLLTGYAMCAYPYKNHLNTYKQSLNLKLGLSFQDYSTKFSPWLATGSLSPRWIYHKLKQYEQERVSNQSTYWVIFELIWRDYFKFVCYKYGDAVFYPGTEIYFLHSAVFQWNVSTLTWRGSNFCLFTGYCWSRIAQCLFSVSDIDGR